MLHAAVNSISTVTVTVAMGMIVEGSNKQLAILQEARPELTNGGEAWLFHGAHKTSVEAIAAKGFDIRVSNRGMLGQGTYFANCSAYSDK